MSEVIAAAPVSVRSSHGPRVDASRASPGREPGLLPPSIAFLAAYGVPPQTLLIAFHEALRVGTGPVAALLACGAMEEDFYYRALARHLSLRFYEPGAARLRGGTHFAQSILAGIAPMTLDDGRDGWLLAPDDRRIAELLRLGRGGRLPRLYLGVTTPGALAAQVRDHEAATIARHASHSLAERDASLSARTEASPGQKLAGSLFGFLTPFGLVYGGVSWTLLCAICGGVLAGAILLRIFAATASFATPAGARRRLKDQELPFYTVAVALHREEEILGQLICALDALDYPAAKLDIKLIVEEDDHGLIAAIKALRLPARYELIRAPAGHPRTKPRALNVALPTARGDLLVVFDAEDRPEPQQLRRAAERFAAAPPQLACLQGSLVVDNARDSWLTRLFAIEYAMLFDVLNPGLAALGLPIPLGGTSNHFRAAALRDATGWDAWNVTEDIDLGLRLARRGYSIEALQTSTDEEAPAALHRWLAQRRRWMKGWIQTLATHSREPGRLIGELGWLRATATMAMVAGGVIGPLLGPLFGFFVLMDAIYGDLLSPSGLVDLLQSTCWVFVGLAGTISVLGPALIGMRRRGLLLLAPWLLLLPAYYALLTAAAWGALIEYFRAPFHWSKTTHGLARTSRRQA